MTVRFHVGATALAGVQVVRLFPSADSRGYLERIYSAEEFEPLIGGKSIAQVNHTLTVRKGTVRGMHFQLAPHSEAKIVHCIRGRVFDVAVDLRRGSPTFLQWHGEILDPALNNLLVIPEGFAHGFQTLAADSEMLYLHTAFYHAEASDGINPTDPRVGIRWPLEIAELSIADKERPFVAADFKGLTV